MPINQIGYGQRSAAFGGIPLTLQPNGAYNLPAGQWSVNAGPYTFLQQFDPVSLVWLPVGTVPGARHALVSSDGTNYRLANLTGTAVGALVTNGGTGYTNGIYPVSAQLGTFAAPSVTMSAGGARPTIIVGGAVATSVAITAGGSAYTLPPTLTFSQPPPGGVQATAVCTLSGGAINAVTVTNQGAGYITAPTITITRHPFDTTGIGGTLTAALTGSGSVTALTFPENGTGGLTTVPTITFAPASTTAATAIVCFSVTAFSSQTSQTGFGTTVPNMGLTIGAAPTTAASTANPRINTGLFVPRLAHTGLGQVTTGTLTPIVDGGLHMSVPLAQLYVSNIAGYTSATANVAPTMGGVTDTSFVIPV
jgi:hypothetical protein